MPQYDSHLIQAQRNLRFLEATTGCFDIVSEYLEWYITIKFYAALHLVDAVFSTTNIHPNDHKARNDGIFKVKKLFTNECARRYLDLYNISLKARYLQGDTKVDLKSDIRDFEEGFEFVKNEIEHRHKIKI